jgi:hypothetical protein
MNNNVIYTIFAGRKRYLEILNVYLEKLIQNNSIHEVHFWCFTTNESDIEYMKSLEIQNSKYKIFYPNRPNKRIWYQYYKYYRKNTNENDIVIKSDDDIVYIDVDQFDNFINNMNKDCMNFPNIINNDVCAYYQTQNNIHDLFHFPPEKMKKINEKINKVGCGSPLSNWFTRFDKADEIHKLFLEDPNKFNMNGIIEYGNRISINFFAIHKKSIYKYFKEIKKHDYDDERNFGRAMERLNKHRIDFSFKIVHFQFSPQNGKELDSRYLNKYKTLANDNKVNL